MSLTGDKRGAQLQVHNAPAVFSVAPLKDIGFGAVWRRRHVNSAAAGARLVPGRGDIIFSEALAIAARLTVRPDPTR